MTAESEIPDSDSVVRYGGQMGVQNGKVDGSQFCRRPNGRIVRQLVGMLCPDGQI